MQHSSGVSPGGKKKHPLKVDNRSTSVDLELLLACLYS